MLNPLSSTLTDLSYLYPPVYTHLVLANISPILIQTTVTWGSCYKADSDSAGV